MQTFMYVEMNVFALAVLFLIYLNVSHRAEKYLVEQKLFLALIGSNALILILDSAMWVLDGRSGSYVKPVYLLVTALYYSLNPFICMVWSFYADYHIHREEARFRKFLIPALLPVLINTILSFASIFGSYMFHIDEHNIYQRGSLFLLMAAICYFYLMYSLIFIIRNRKRIQKQYYISILVFAFPPFLGGIIQTLYYGVSLIWVCMTISLLIVFINIQYDQLCTDHLTGLFNRRQLDYYIQQRMQGSNGKSLFAGIMIDLDSFKTINDMYGHHVGDQALVNIANILRGTFRNSDFIARFGGDEFVVIMEAQNRSDLIMAVDRLLENVSHFNKENALLYRISLSIGSDFIESSCGMTTQDFINHIDGLMYENKLNRRSADGVTFINDDVCEQAYSTCTN